MIILKATQTLNSSLLFVIEQKAKQQQLLDNKNKERRINGENKKTQMVKGRKLTINSCGRKGNLGFLEEENRRRWWLKACCCPTLKWKREEQRSHRDTRLWLGRDEDRDSKASA